MLPASDLTEIITNLTALNLQPNTVAAVLGAVLAPLLRNGPSPDASQVRHPKLLQKCARGRLGRPRRKKPKRRRTARPMEARERARAALQANPGKSLTAVAKIAGVSRSTVVTASGELAAKARKEARKEARKQRETPKAVKPIPEHRRRAQAFLRDALAHGPKRATDVEAAAAKAHIEMQMLAQAASDLGIVTSRANAGGVQAVTWSLPG